MNERFEKLVAKAFFDRAADAADTKVYKLNDAVMQKFAESIVGECADIVASRPYIDDGQWPHPSTMIRKHFGVDR